MHEVLIQAWREQRKVAEGNLSAARASGNEEEQRTIMDRIVDADHSALVLAMDSIRHTGKVPENLPKEFHVQPA